ncbi:hypothetical protein DPMN_134560 [Dreissena polymorpha]|uniref:Uncharacterized protein n=1 Tax=Dreissena polymorpha TaxID=45954 RepID=A0A9D4JAT3_DREPO|nr:hypothetical protein DPMN_134560 [Dreissena polymorpha]
MDNYSKAKAEQTYFAIRGRKVKRVDAASVIEVVIDLLRTDAADLLRVYARLIQTQRRCADRCRVPRRYAASTHDSAATY